MKHFALLFLILVLGISSSFSGFAIDNKSIEGSDGFAPQDINLGDDAFHGHGILPYTEWWYFDAMFSNGYSTQMSVRIISVFGKGFVSQQLNLYKDGVLIIHDSTSYRLKEIFASSKVPFVQIHRKTILAGLRDNTTGDFVYNLSFDFPGSVAVLRFVGCTKGWKGQHQSGDWWAVVLPRATVTGMITIDNTTMNVEGTGYHDHNWDVSARACFHFGWFWGKFDSTEYTAIWSGVLSTRATVQPIMVVNKKNAEYIAIPSKTIWFSAKDFHLDHFMFVPHFFNIETMTNKVFLVVNMQVSSVDHERVMGFMNYWRYHVKCSGIFMVDGHAETVDSVFIAEYIRFR
jgi:predicted secreted hydrolase